MSAWPLFDLRITTPLLELRLPGEAELLDLADRACGNILDADTHHRMNGWTRVGAPEFQHSFMRHHWKTRANFSPEKWDLPLGIYPQGERAPVGIMGVSGTDFPQCRLVGTGSWILRDRQGQGLGREARAAVLQLAFAGLGAREAHSTAVPDNEPSNRVSLGLGYEPNGHLIVRSGDTGRTVRCYRLTRERWQPHADITISELEPCLPLLGLSPAPS